MSRYDGEYLRGWADNIPAGECLHGVALMAWCDDCLLELNQRLNP